MSFEDLLIAKTQSGWQSRVKLGKQYHPYNVFMHGLQVHPFITPLKVSRSIWVLFQRFAQSISGDMDTKNLEKGMIKP